MADMRKCIGSAKFGIVAHEAPVGEFPTQPSQKDGLGRMCKPHWTEYTAGLGRDRKARVAGPFALPDPKVSPDALASALAAHLAKRTNARGGKKPEAIRTKPARGRKTTPAPGFGVFAEPVSDALAPEPAVEEASIA